MFEVDSLNQIINQGGLEASGSSMYSFMTMSHRKTSAKVAKQAAKVLSNPHSSKAAKAAAASALSQRATHDRHTKKR